jgi:hypothetical protein
MDEEEGYGIEIELGPEFEIDFCTCLNMMQGMSYDEAVKEARKQFKEAHEDN